MSFDTSRFTFDPWKSYAGVVMEQGRVQTDADWNEWLSELGRRSRAGTLDTMGHAVYPETTPNAFKIDAATSGGTNTIRIGLGRMYVDGILVENHGDQSTATWDPALAELSNVPQPQPSTPQTLDATNSILFQDQPYNSGAVVPPGPGQYVAYLDVWQRPITYIEDSSLIDVAIGVDTTGRIQTAWRVNLLPLPAVVVAGSVTNGTFSPGDVVTQATSGATAIVIGSVPAAGPMTLTLVSGTVDATDTWSNAGGAQFTPIAAPEGAGSLVNGSVTSGTFAADEEVMQQSTGASATLSQPVPAAGPMTMGAISGPPAALSPWIGQTSGAVFTPAGLPSSSISTIAGAVSSGTFSANEQVKQNSTGAVANLIGTVVGAGPMVVGTITGEPDSSNDWVGQTSGATFTPTAAPSPSGWSCSTSDYSMPWPASAGTLTTQPVSAAQTGPCCLTTGSGYTGPENQFYRIEIHTPGGAGAAGATFKWSRENASIQTAVTAIAAASNSLGTPSSSLTVQSLGRDQVLGFTAGDWIEITDETHDNSCLPGEIYKIDSVQVATSSIILTTPLSANFTTTTLSANAYTRIIRWNQSGQVYKVVAGKQQPYYNLDASPSPGALPNGCGGIPVPTDGSPIVLESGIAISFGLAVPTGCLQAMDYWNFTARTADGSIEPLKDAPPRGISHHCTKLSIVSFSASGTPSATDCRTAWPPPSSGGSDCGCCCSVTVGDGKTSHGTFTSIQNAIDSLQNGGEICVEPGQYYEHVLIAGKQNIKIKGCGNRTRVFSPSLQQSADASASSGSGVITVAGVEAVFTIVSSENITLECLSVTADDGEVGVLMDEAGIATVNDVGLSKQLRSPDKDILISDLDLSASTLPAIAARYTADLTICDNRIVMKNVASFFSAVYLEGNAIRFERNLVRIASLDSVQSGPTQVIPGVTYTETEATIASTSGNPKVLAVGGVQVAGPSNDVWIVENEIEGGTRNGITLGNIIYLDDNGNGNGQVVGVQTQGEDPCSGGGTATIPGTTTVDATTTRVAAGGRIRNLHILRNRIRDVGMCGIGPVGFFNLKSTLEIVSLENVLIAENILINTLARNVLAATIDESPYGYGVISLPDVLNLIVRDNIISNYGVSPGAEVCGIYVYHGEGIDIDSNQIREVRDLSGALGVKWANYGGKRAGIYIDLATPPTLDTSAKSVWTESINNVYKTDQSDAFRNQAPDYTPGFSALRIENNTVRVAFGLALYAIGTGPFSILGNHFSTGGTVSAESGAIGVLAPDSSTISSLSTVTGALTVEVLNLGLALEVFDLIESYSNLYAANGALSGESDSSLSVTNGAVLFSNNICQLMTQLNSVRGLSSVALMTLDHLMFTNNQLWMNGSPRTALVDALLFGVTVQAVTNRLQESANAVIDSGISYGLMNNTSQNISTYCFLSKAATAQGLVDTQNLVMHPARCEQYVKQGN